MSDDTTEAQEAKRRRARDIRAETLYGEALRARVDSDDGPTLFLIARLITELESIDGWLEAIWEDMGK